MTPLLLHPLVETILTTGKISLPDGITRPAAAHIPREECELLYRQVAATKPIIAVEVGMAFGISTLCLCDALRKQGSIGRLIVMDPAQNDSTWQGNGLALVRSAGFADLVEFHERPSQLVLPEMVANGTRAQMVFIDGWHTFDHTLVDFFYADLLLDPGGVIILDDVGYPAINAVVRFILSNRDYELVESLQQPRPPFINRAKTRLKTWLGRLSRTNHTPRADHQRLFQTFELAHSVALRKRGEDSRRWDHYFPF